MRECGYICTRLRNRVCVRATLLKGHTLALALDSISRVEPVAETARDSQRVVALGALVLIALLARSPVCLGAVRADAVECDSVGPWGIACL